MAKHNPFDSPIPGQSLTDEPGARSWEKPPKYNRPEEVLDYIWDKLTEEKQAIKLLALLEAGVPAQGVAETILFAGFTEGLWTPDVMLLVGKPVFAMVVSMGKRAGIKVKVGSSDRDELNDFLEELAGAGTVAAPPPKEIKIEPEVAEEVGGGLMGKKGLL